MARACPHCGARHPASLSRCPATGFPIERAAVESTAGSGDPGLVGSTIHGRYHLVRLLGDGGMGAVYKAADQVLRRFVAIKLLHPSVARNPSSVERFQREGRAAAAIGHPNIIDILDFGLEGTRPYMVMEYLRGRSLSQVISSEGALPIRRACTIATHTLAGLAAAHDRGILHRDLKPANLMLVARFGDRNFVKVCDFGFAALFGGGGSADQKTLTPERTLVGTPAYAAPERLRGDDRRDPRTDVYSVGVVLWEMLAGRRPFDAPTFAELARKVRNEPPPSLRAVRRDVPEALEQVIAKALSKKNEDRWPSAEDFAAALVPFGGRNIQIDDDSPSDSFTFEMMRIKARKKNTRPSIELPRDEAAALRTGAAGTGGAAERPAAPKAPSIPAPRQRPAIEVPAVPRPVDRRRDSFEVPLEVAIPIEVEAPQPDPDDDYRSTQRKPLQPQTDPTIRTAPLDARHAAEIAGGLGAATSPPATSLRGLTEPAPPPDLAPEPATLVAGKLVLSVLRFVARKHGERALKDLLDGMPDEARTPFDAGIEADGWVDGASLLALVEAIDARLGNDDLHMVLECGRAAAEGAFDVMRQVRPPSPPAELLLAEMPQVMETLAQGLALVVRRLGKGYARVELMEQQTPSLVMSVLVLGFLERSLERFGAEDVEVNLLGARALEDEETLIDVSWLG